MPNCHAVVGSNFIGGNGVNMAISVVNLCDGRFASTIARKSVEDSEREIY